MGIFVFWTDRTRLEPSVAMATALRVSFCFFCDAHLWCQVSRTLLQYFQRYRLFSIQLPAFSCKQYDIIIDLICIIEKCQYLCILKDLSNKQKAFFMSYAL